ncbi:MAG: hypothetical protein M3312_11300 [Actinomycetota bacterium]|nr:hypothetical protein [Actinomycetota bacterium]
MAKRQEDAEPPAGLEPAVPEESQTSVHEQTVGPDVAESDAPSEPAERTLEEERRRKRDS